MVINYYFVSFSFKFHEDPCTNARARVVNAHMHVLSHELKFEFQKDPTFGDICKISLTFLPTLTYMEAEMVEISINPANS